MEEIDKESIKYIAVKAYKLDYWRYAVNSTTEFSVIKQSDLITMIYSLGLFNKEEFVETISHHNDFIFDNKEKKVITLLNSRDFTSEDIAELIWGDIEKSIKKDSSSFVSKFNSLFGTNYNT